MANRIDYRRAKILLNKYHKFSFGMPRKGKDFTPAQKSSITKKMRELGEIIVRVVEEKASYIPLTKSEQRRFRGMDLKEVKTNKGIFVNYREAKLGYEKDTKKPVLWIKEGKRREVAHYFPAGVRHSLDAIRDYVDGLRERYKPSYIRWIVNGYAGSQLYVPEAFEEYAHKIVEERGAKYAEDEPYYVGVFFGYAPNLDPVILTAEDVFAAREHRRRLKKKSLSARKVTASAAKTKPGNRRN